MCSLCTVVYRYIMGLQVPHVDVLSIASTYVFYTFYIEMDKLLSLYCATNFCHFTPNNSSHFGHEHWGHSWYLCSLPPMQAPSFYQQQHYLPWWSPLHRKQTRRIENYSVNVKNNYIILLPWILNNNELDEYNWPCITLKSYFLLLFRPFIIKMFTYYTILIY